MGPRDMEEILCLFAFLSILNSINHMQHLLSTNIKASKDKEIFRFAFPFNYRNCVRTIRMKQSYCKSVFKPYKYGKCLETAQLPKVVALNPISKSLAASKIHSNSPVAVHKTHRLAITSRIYLRMAV